MPASDLEPLRREPYLEAPARIPEPAVYAYPIPPERVDPDAAKVLKRLVRYGYEAYLVGGGVRDLILGRAPKDFDVATSALPQDVRRLFRNCRIIGRRFRLAHVLFAGGKVIEVATFRREPTQRYAIVPPRTADGMGLLDGPAPERIVPVQSSETDEDLLIRSDNVFGSPHEDSLRRDFTINGLFYDLERGEVIDYVGGMRDLQLGIVTTIGDPGVRFREDPVRILRAIKFSARIDLGIDPEVYEAMVEHRAELGKAAPPRLFEELLRLLRGGAAHRSIYLAWDTGVLAAVLPELACFLDDDALDARTTWGRLQEIDRLQAEGCLPDDSVLLAGLLLGPILEALEDARDPASAFQDFIDEISMRLTIPRRIKDRIRLIVSSQRRLRAGRLGALPRRDFFPDARTLFAIDASARGEELPEWASDPRMAEGSPTRRRHRRRRRGDRP